jgi:hypothetical protein
MSDRVTKRTKLDTAMTLRMLADATEVTRDKGCSAAEYRFVLEGFAAGMSMAASIAEGWHDKRDDEGLRNLAGKQVDGCVVMGREWASEQP